MDRDFLQSRGRPCLREVDNQPVWVGHELSAWGDRLACRDLDAKVASVTGDSYAANDGKLLPSLSQLHTAAEQYDTENQHFRTQKAPNSTPPSLEYHFHSPSPFHKTGYASVAKFIITTRQALYASRNTRVIEREVLELPW